MAKLREFLARKGWESKCTAILLILQNKHMDLDGSNLLERCLPTDAGTKIQFTSSVAQRLEPLSRNTLSNSPIALFPCIAIYVAKQCYLSQLNWPRSLPCRLRDGVFLVGAWKQRVWQYPTLFRESPQVQICCSHDLV